MNRDQRDQLLAAAAADLRATEEGASYLLPAEAAGHLADMLLWVVGSPSISLVNAAVALAECLVIDDSERAS